MNARQQTYRACAVEYEGLEEEGGSISEGGGESKNLSKFFGGEKNVKSLICVETGGWLGGLYQSGICVWFAPGDYIPTLV